MTTQTIKDICDKTATDVPTRIPETRTLDIYPSQGNSECTVSSFPYP